MLMDIKICQFTTKMKNEIEIIIKNESNSTQ